jgi:hypothetical protein
MASLRRYDSPAVPALVALPVASLFVVLRWKVAAHRRLGDFVVAGSRYTSRARIPKGLPVASGSGYDGQFYYRLALDPFDLARTAFGVRLDSLSRVERMGYPFLAWLVARGQPASVPLALVVVNVIACGVVALAGGLLAKSAGRHSLWGLVFAGYWGYLWTLGRDLTELTAAAFLLLGLAALVRQAPVLSGVAFLCATVSKETSVLLVGTLALTALYLRVTEPPLASVLSPNGWSTGASAPGASAPGAFAPRTSTRGSLSRLAPRRSDLAFLIPIGGFLAWQVVLLDATGKVPIYRSGGENLGIPFVGLAHGLSHYLPPFPTTASALWLAELLVLTFVVVGGALSFRAAPVEFRTLWVVSVLLMLSTATGIWLGDVGFRSLDDAYLMSWLLLLNRRGPIWPWGLLCAGTWIVVFVELVRFI